MKYCKNLKSNYCKFFIKFSIFGQKMKYLFLGIIIVIGVCAIYFTLPKDILGSTHVKSNCKIQTLQRIVYNEKNIKDSLDGLVYSLINDDFANPTLVLDQETKPLYINLNNYTDASNNAMIMASYSLRSNGSLIERIKNWLINYKIKNQLKVIIEKIGLNCEDLTNAYGGDIVHTNLTDSTLIYIKTATDSFPTVAEIYNKIQLLENYAVSKGAKSTNPPMLNIKKIRIDDTKFEFSVALPINKDLPSFDNIVPKRMLVGGKFLTTTVIGGLGNVSKMETNLENYLSDYSYSSPAIPFQSLVTNRLDQKDSTQWITKLYYPIF